MERTLDEALMKIFPGLSGISPSIPEELQSVDSGSTIAREERNLILSRTDYEKIQSFYKKVVESQGKLDQSLSSYKKELEALGQVLQEVPVSLQPMKPSGE
jgi:hypothetical protein